MEHSDPFGHPIKTLVYARLLVRTAPPHLDSGSRREEPGDLPRAEDRREDRAGAEDRRAEAGRRAGLLQLVPLTGCAPGRRIPDYATENSSGNSSKNPSDK